jgi:hypothetical protein
MGTIFKYLTDEALARSAESGPCPGCSTDAPVFRIEAAPHQEEWTGSDPMVEALCAQCLRSTPLRRLEPRDQEMDVQRLLSQHYPKGVLTGRERLGKLVGICDELRRTPRAPLFLQGEDWPFCCGDFAEYVGYPDSYEAAGHIGRTAAYWDRGPASFLELHGEAALEPESLEEVCIFRCLDCSTLLFTWQAT